MRLIGTLPSEAGARRLSAYLTSQGMQHLCEAAFDPAAKKTVYQIWVEEEDRLAEALEAFRQFEQNPSDAKFSILVETPKILQAEASAQGARRRGAPVTSLFLSLCIFFYFLNLLQENSLEKQQLPEAAFFLTPVQALLLYDLPPSFSTLAHALQEGRPISSQQVEAAEQSPYWQGLYELLVLKLQKKGEAQAEGPLFEKIREGEFWRLFTPSLLHLNLLHIFFNMIWLWILGRPVELRIGPWKTLLLTVVIGIVVNTAQYLMSGPFFLGYSGIIMGLAGFIWMREKMAPWEGYPVHRSTLIFLGGFVLAMFGLQAIAFFVQLFTKLPFSLMIANTAHLAGALFGALLGRLSFFSWRVR